MFPFFSWFFNKYNYIYIYIYTKYFNVTVHTFFICNVLPSMVCPSHKLGNCCLFSSCGQDISIHLNTRVTKTLCMTHYFLFDVSMSPAYFHCFCLFFFFFSAQLLLVPSLFYFGCTWVDREIRSLVLSKSREKIWFLCLNISGFSVIGALWVGFVYIFHTFQKLVILLTY